MDSAQTDNSMVGGQSARPWAVLLAVVLCASAFNLIGGPPLGEHEATVALIARHSLQSRDWLVPVLLDAPYLVKPPLIPWAVAAASSVLPADAVTGLPVTPLAARAPSWVATLLTVWILFYLGRSMFGRRGGWLAAFLYASSIGTGLYAINATAEAMLTLFCTWAFAEFWWALRRPPQHRRMHLLRFYLAFGLAMLTKGPMPLAMVGVPLAAYWWISRPARLWAAGGLGGARNAFRLAVRQAWPRFQLGLRSLGVWWGVPIFLLMFLPWMLYVAGHLPYAWRLWDYEYLRRLSGDYPGDEKNGAYYFLPILLGFAIPWTLSVPEALASPFLAFYRRRREALIYCWFWVVTGVLIMSLMSFKKPYYILPSLPGLALLLTPVLERLFFGLSRAARIERMAVIAILTLCAIALIAGWVVVQNKYPELLPSEVPPWAILGSGLAVLAGFALAGSLFLRGRREASLAIVGISAVVAFSAGWRSFGPTLEHHEEPLTVARRLAQLGVPATTPLFWLSARPDPRVTYYGNRPVRQVVDTDRLIAEADGEWTNLKLKTEVAQRACDLLHGPEPAYVLLERRQLDQLKLYFDLRASELFTVDCGRQGPDRRDWVIITNNLPAVSSSHENAAKIPPEKDSGRT